MKAHVQQTIRDIEARIEQMKIMVDLLTALGNAADIDAGSGGSAGLVHTQAAPGSTPGPATSSPPATRRRTRDGKAGEKPKPRVRPPAADTPPQAGTQDTTRPRLNPAVIECLRWMPVQFGSVEVRDWLDEHEPELMKTIGMSSLGSTMNQLKESGVIKIVGERKGLTGMQNLYSVVK